MTFEIQILGCGAATPTAKHMPTSQLVNVHDKLFLVDCGEGTQIQIRRYKVKFQKIDHIFISHLHGDHFFGLVGLLSSMHLLGRTKQLTIFAPKQLEAILEVQFEASQTRLSFPIKFVDSIVKEKTLLLEDKTLEIYAFPLKHRVPCSGFLFQEKPRKAKIRKAFIKLYDLGIEEMVNIKNRTNVERPNGEVISWKECTYDDPPVKSYAFCSDTAPSPKVEDVIKDVTLLYHEATFHSSLKDRAVTTFHSTSLDAGNIAAKCNVGHLVIGHFSSRYMDESILLEEALTQFERTSCANEGLKFVLKENPGEIEIQDMNRSKSNCE